MLFAELEILERLDRAEEAADAGADLRGACEADGRAHFGRHRLGEIGAALLIFLDDTAEQRQALLPRRLRIGLIGLLGGGDGIVDAVEGVGGHRLVIAARHDILRSVDE